MKRFVSVLIALLLVLAMVPAMASAEGTIKRQENGLPDFEGRVFTIWYKNRQPQTADDLGEMQVVKKLEEMLNCDIQFIHPPQGQESEHFAIMMAEDKLPDMIFCGGIKSYYPGGVTAAYDDGILYDYTDLINETNTPNFMEIMLGDEFLAPLMKDDYGRIINLGAKIQGSEDCNHWYGCLVIRKDHLAATGMDVPETIAEWDELLTAMKANGVEYPLHTNNGWYYEFFAPAYGILSRELYLDEAGTVHYGPYEPAYKDWLTLMNKWYTEGLINPDFMNDNAGSENWPLLADGKAGAVHAHIWGWANEYYLMNDNPEQALVGAQIPKLNEEDELTNLRYTSRNMDDFKYITVDAEDPLACVVLLDTLYNPEISTMMANGIEGVAWEANEVGYPSAIADADPMSKAISEWHAYEDTVAEHVDSKWGEECGEYLRMVSECGTSGRLMTKFLMYTSEEAEIRSDLRTDIETYMDEMQLKFITGQESLDNFDAYIEQLKALGVEEWIAVEQAAYDRLQARR